MPAGEGGPKPIGTSKLSRYASIPPGAQGAAMTDQADAGPGSADTPGRAGGGDALRPVLAPGEWDVFISYSRKDHAFATRLHAALNAYQPPRDLPLPKRR